MKHYLILGEIETMRSFKKYFETEYERDKFARKLKYSKKLVVLDRGTDYI